MLMLRKVLLADFTVLSQSRPYASSSCHLVGSPAAAHPVSYLSSVGSYSRKHKSYCAQRGHPFADRDRDDIQRTVRQRAIIGQKHESFSQSRLSLHP